MELLTYTTPQLEGGIDNVYWKSLCLYSQNNLFKQLVLFLTGHPFTPHCKQFAFLTSLVILEQLIIFMDNICFTFWGLCLFANQLNQSTPLPCPVMLSRYSAAFYPVFCVSKAGSVNFLLSLRVTNLVFVSLETSLKVTANENLRQEAIIFWYRFIVCFKWN